MRCKILQDFKFSRNGIVVEIAVKDTIADIPANLVDGLAATGLLLKNKGEPKPWSKDLGASPENQMLDPSPEDKAKPKWKPARRKAKR